MQHLPLCLLILAALSVSAHQFPDFAFAKMNYKKTEMEISIRDGMRLYTAIFGPKDNSQNYPILLHRTCYHRATNREDALPLVLSPNAYLMEGWYIFVQKDVKERYISQVNLINKTPIILENKPDNLMNVNERSDFLNTIK